ncbi:MAG: hypothetical protein ACREFY_07115, partial [Acetobacteraceae bacterium]
MKTAFKVAGSEPQATAPAAGLGAARLATLRKTFDNVRVQAPEIAIRPIQEIASELAVAALTLGDAGGTLAPDAVAFRREVDTELAGLKARAAGIAAGHVATWRTAISALPAVGADASLDAKRARALAIQKLLADIEPGVARDIYMLKQVGATPTALEDISDVATALKMEYGELRPTRKSTGEPVRLPAVARPAIKGALTLDDGRALDKAMKDTQALMGSDRKTDPAVVNAAVALIAKGINVERADVAMKRLKTWVAVKEEYRTVAKTAPERAKAFMAEMWWFRRMKVDALMTRLQEKY